MTEQGYPPRQPGHPGRQGRSRTSREPAGGGWQVLDAFDEGADSESDLPPWAIPGGIAPQWATRRPRPGQPGDRGGSDRPAAAGGTGYDPQGPGSAGQETAGAGQAGRPGRRAGRRALAARRRRYQRRLVTWGSVAVVIVLAVGGGLWLSRSVAPKSPYITTLQKGEYRRAPDACRVIGAAGLRALLHGMPKSVQTYNGPQQSQCTYTVDKQPVFRVLMIRAQAYTASLTAAGNGSATANATYNFARQRALLAKPPKHTQLPPATITAIRGLGSAAFCAVQVFRTSSVTDWVTVTVRYRNEVFTASLQGQSGGGFGPVTTDELRANALTVARAVFAEVKAEQTVS